MPKRPIFTTLAIGEEGDPYPFDPPKLDGPWRKPKPYEPPPYEATTLAIGEEGDPYPFPSEPPIHKYPSKFSPPSKGPKHPGPPEVTTLAIGEEDDGFGYDTDPFGF